MQPNCLLACICLVLCSAVTQGTSPAVATEPRQWSVELTIRQFKIHCDFELESTKTLVDELDAMSRDIQQLLTIPTTEQTVHIVLFQTPGEYARYMQNYFPTLPQRRAIFIQDRGPGMLFTHWHENVTIDLRHEVAHALLNQQSSRLPLWLDEGLAEYFEVESTLRFIGNPYLKEVAERAHNGFIPSLKQLEQVDKVSSFGDAQYRDSWSWVHFLLHRSGETRALLIQFIQRSRDGSPQLDLSRQLAALIPDLSAEYQQHFQSLSTNLGK